MIISKTPYRISFFGGGTDYPQWYCREGGAVLSTTIDKYCTITCREFPPFFNYKHRIVWSYIESASSYKEILHPAVKAVLRYMEIEDKIGLEIHHQGDLPARSGMGTSASFVVGLLNALSVFKGRMVSQMELGLQAIEVEQNVLKESVGSQDQIAVAQGGLNTIYFNTSGEIQVVPMSIPAARQFELESNLMLFYTGSSRMSSEIASNIIENIPRKKTILRMMRGYVDQAINLLDSKDPLNDFGILLHESWLLKKELSPLISNETIDRIYDAARKNGAIGGKLLGAGGTGFMLFYVPLEYQAKVRQTLSQYIEVPLKFENQGAVILNYQSCDLQREDLFWQQALR
ncbi:MAG: kinase [Chlamydiales bacterium]|jgi:D-glycero-alpha-D-manno-heptose-7-phosphate kinase|nr:kinase [Chlamydiales bacterium]